MNRILLVITTTVFIISSASVLAWDGKRGHHQRDGFNIERMEDVLNLSETQVDQLYKIKREAKKERKAAMKAMKQDDKPKGLMALDPGAADYQAQVQALAEFKADMARNKTLKRAEYHAKIYEVLTPEQRETLKQHMQERREKMREKRMEKRAERQDW